MRRITSPQFSLESGGDLLSRAVTSQVPSALKGLTSVFGMGTGDPLRHCRRNSLNALSHIDSRTQIERFAFCLVLGLLKSNPRPISIGKHTHCCAYTADLSPGRLPGALLLFRMGTFFLRLASRLDAFSVYPSRTSLPCYALGSATVAPVVRPLRSSRTRSRSSHDSYAHDG